MLCNDIVTVTTYLSSCQPNVIQGYLLRFLLFTRSLVELDQKINYVSTGVRFVDCKMNFSFLAYCAENLRAAGARGHGGIAPPVCKKYKQVPHFDKYIACIFSMPDNLLLETK